MYESAFLKRPYSNLFFIRFISIVRNFINLFSHFCFYDNLFTFFEKHMRIKVYTHFKNRVNYYQQQTNTIKNFFWQLTIMKNCVDFFLTDFNLVSKYSLLYTGSLSNTFLIISLTLSQISLYFSRNSLSFIKKTYI